MGVKIRKTGKSEILGGKIYSFNPPPPPGGVLPCISYIGMYRHIGHRVGFCAVLV